MRTTRTLAAAMSAALVLALAGPASAQSSIKGTKHDLSAAGPGPYRASQESRVCIFCHVPHNAAPDAPLWNRADSGSFYQPYQSTTQQSAPGQPSGTSRLCLSCHDGTVALGAVLAGGPAGGGSIPFSGSDTITTGTGLLGTDLRDDHPISMPYDAAANAAGAELKTSAAIPAPVALDAAGLVQCTSCHEPHSDTFGKFLVQNQAFSALCLACHQPTGWAASSHATSNATWNGTGQNPWPHTTAGTVAEKGCLDCHAPHHAQIPARLQAQTPEEQACLSCHNGNVASTNIAAELQKTRTHPVANSFGVHDPTEDPLAMSKHVECQDCHDPHEARPHGQGTGGLEGPLTGAPGLDDNGTTVDRASAERNVCFRCHADNPVSTNQQIIRQVDDRNVRREVDPAGASFHPVRAAANVASPSLIPPLTVSSMITCTDCHNNDQGPGAGGTGPRGPHGSQWTYLVERRYTTADFTLESAQAYDLCYKCHDRTSILNDESFEHHGKHLRGAKAPCSACHDPHGISPNATPTEHRALINFDTSIALPVNGTLRFTFDAAKKEGSCTLLCHNKRHDPKTYQSRR